jgi:hypothetical protein
MNTICNTWRRFVSLAVVAATSVALTVTVAEAQYVWTYEKRCERCGRVVPSSSAVGQRCPFCGVVWTVIVDQGVSTGGFGTPPAQTGAGTSSGFAAAVLDRQAAERAAQVAREQESAAQRALEAAVARRRQESLDRQRSDLSRFLNGDTTPEIRERFRKTLMEFEQTPEMVRMLNARVPRVPAGDLVPTTVAVASLQSDGTLASPPPELLDRSAIGPLGVAHQAFDAAWNDVVMDLRNGVPVDRYQLAGLREALGTWRAAAEVQLRGESAVARWHVRRYFESLTSLLDTLADVKRSWQLREFVGANRSEFPGGTVAELIEYILQRNVRLRYGSDVQLTIAEFGRDLRRQLDARAQTVPTYAFASPVGKVDSTAGSARSCDCAQCVNHTHTLVDRLPFLKPSSDVGPSSAVQR